MIHNDSRYIPKDCIAQAVRINQKIPTKRILLHKYRHCLDPNLRAAYLLF
ncbi:hypothetical protein [Ethanoligenens sp.]